MKWALTVASCALFATTALVRYLELNGFPNDQFQHLAGAQQILMGEWPTKDFFDPGQPLMYLASAGAQLLLGRTLLAEAILIAVAYGVAAACTLVAAHRVSRSLVVGVFAAVLSVAIFPRPYGYPKVLLYAVGPLVMWAWMRKPTLGRLIWPAVFVAAAFLFRHDHGLYLGAAALATIALTPAESWKQAFVRAAVFCALVVLVLVPYVVYVGMYGGVADYVRTGIEYSQREADRTRLDVPAFNWGHDARLFYLFHALPLCALACVAVNLLRRRSTDAALVVPLAVTAILVNVGFLRDPLLARLPDVVVPAVLLGAWLAGRALHVSSRRLRLAAIASACIVAVTGAASVNAVGNTYDHLDRTTLTRGIARVPEVFRARAQELRARFSRDQMPDSGLLLLVPFFTYLDRCTTSQQRLLVAGNAPEVFVYSRRMFAGGQSTFIQGYNQSAKSQQLVIDRMQHQLVLFVLLLTDNVNWQGFSKLDTFVMARFQPMVDIPINGERTVRVLVNPDVRPLISDAETGWPCYR